MNRQQLSKTLGLMKSCLSSQDIIPVLKHFCFDSKLKKVTAYNGFQAACLILDIGLTCALPGDLLLKLLNNYSSEKIILEQVGSDVLLKSGSSKTKLASFPSEDFIFQEPDSMKGYERKLDTEFIESLENCSISVNDNPQVKNQTGITLIQDDKNLDICSTDGVCISRCTVKSSFDIFTTMLPKLFCEQVILWFREFGEGTILFGDTFVRADFSQGFLYSKLDSEVEFLDYKSGIAEILPSRISYAEVPKNLVNVLDRSLLLTSSELDQIVDITISEGFMDIVTVSPHGTIRDPIDLGDVIKKDLQFKIDCKLLKRAIESIQEMTFVQSGDSVLFVGRDNNFLHLVASFK